MYLLDIGQKKHIPTIIDGHRDGFHHGFFSYHKIIPTEWKI